MGIRKAFIPVDARVAMSDSTKKVDQCCCKAASAPGMESKVY